MSEARQGFAAVQGKASGAALRRAGEDTLRLRSGQALKGRGQVARGHTFHGLPHIVLNRLYYIHIIDCLFAILIIAPL